MIVAMQCTTDSIQTLCASTTDAGFMSVLKLNEESTLVYKREHMCTSSFCISHSPMGRQFDLGEIRRHMLSKARGCHTTNFQTAMEKYNKTLPDLRIERRNPGAVVTTSVTGNSRNHLTT